MRGRASRRMVSAGLLTGQKEVRLMWSSSAILALNETRIFIATIDAILASAIDMSIYKTWTCRKVNRKMAKKPRANIAHDVYWV